MAHGHLWKKINDVKVCVKCGLTITDDNRVIFDRGLPDYSPINCRKVRKRAKHEKII